MIETTNMALVVGGPCDGELLPLNVDGNGRYHYVLTQHGPYRYDQQDVHCLIRFDQDFTWGTYRCWMPHDEYDGFLAESRLFLVQRLIAFLADPWALEPE